MYASGIARFTSPDPVLSSGRIESPQTWNRYLYVLGNPIKFSDPLGLYYRGILFHSVNNFDYRHTNSSSSGEKELLCDFLCLGCGHRSTDCQYYR